MDTKHYDRFDVFEEQVTGGRRLLVYGMMHFSHRHHDKITVDITIHSNPYETTASVSKWSGFKWEPVCKLLAEEANKTFGEEGLRRVSLRLLNLTGRILAPED